MARLLFLLNDEKKRENACFIGDIAKQ